MVLHKISLRSHSLSLDLRLSHRPTRPHTHTHTQLQGTLDAEGGVFREGGGHSSYTVRQLFPWLRMVPLSDIGHHLANLTLVHVLHNCQCGSIVHDRTVTGMFWSPDHLHRQKIPLGPPFTWCSKWKLVTAIPVHQKFPQVKETLYSHRETRALIYKKKTDCTQWMQFSNFFSALCQSHSASCFIEMTISLC